MKNLQEATERICELKGSLVAMDALVPAVIQALSPPTRARLIAAFDAHAEAARTVLLYADVSDLVLATFEKDVARNRKLLRGDEGAEHHVATPAAIDPLLLRATRLTTYAGPREQMSASGFFYRSAERLFLVSNRRLLLDAAHDQRPDRIEIGVHIDPSELARHVVISLPLCREGVRQWREASDGPEGIAALEIPADSLPAGAEVQAFDETHLELRGEQIMVGDALTIAGFPSGLHDTVHHLAVACSASMASAYGVRFQGLGCFLMDTRTRRGGSGSPVVRRRRLDGASAASWQLIGVHSNRMDKCAGDRGDDQSLGLHGAWYADVLPALTSSD